MLKLFLVNLCVLIVLITTIEIAFRYSKIAPTAYSLDINSPISPLKLSENPLLGYEYKKNFVPALASEKQTNNFGYRDKDREINKKPGTKRIAMIGDSVLDGNFSEALYDRSFGIYDYKNLLHYQTQQLFESVEILNFSVNGYCTSNEAEMAVKTVSLFEPDLVLINFVNNDYDECFGMLQTINNADSKFLEYLFKNSDIFRFIAVRFNLFKFNKYIQINKNDNKMVYFSNTMKKNANQLRESLGKLKPTYTDDDYNKAFNYFYNMTYISEKSTRKSDSWKYHQVKRSLSIIKETFKNKPIILTIWPDFEDLGFQDKEFDHTIIKVEENKDLLIEQICKELNIKSYRLSNIFNRELTTTSPNKDLTISDKMHLNEKGAKLIAPIFLKILSENM